MKKNLSWIIFCVDRSGSMSSIRADMIGGFNAFIKAQRDANIGDCNIFVYQFDTEYTTIFENLNIGKVPELTEATYQPRGGTALYNSLGKTINDIGAKLAALPESERPEKVLVVTITDGEDNSTLSNFSVSEYNSSKVKEMITHQTKVYNWQFVYIGANQDAWAVGSSMGVTNNLNYVADSAGTAYAFDNLTKSTLSYRSAGPARAFAFTPDTSAVEVNVNINPAKKTKTV